MYIKRFYNCSILHFSITLTPGSNLRSVFCLLCIQNECNLRKSPRARVEDGRKREQDAARPDDEQEYPGARFRHPWLERANDGNVSEINKKSLLFLVVLDIRGLSRQTMKR